MLEPKSRILPRKISISIPIGGEELEYTY